MSAPHTPGPWSIVEYGTPDSLVIHSDDQNRVCFMATHGGSRDQWEHIQSNAALIAASPELLEASRIGLAAMEQALAELLSSVCLLDENLQPIRETCEDEAEAQRLEADITKVRAIVAKAEGRS